MFDMLLNSMGLFFKGRLFKDVGSMLRQLIIGVVITVAILLVLVKVAGLSALLSICISSLIGGALQPYLFKNLKYA